MRERKIRRGISDHLIFRRICFSVFKVLDLFSGIGGFSLGLERTGKFKTVAFCEIDPFCQKVLKKHWPEVPIFEDVRTIDYAGTVDVITGGYPCQPFSFAGKRGGQADDRHLWPAMFAQIKKHRPTWVIGENVAGHVSMGLDEVLSDLEGEGYACRPFIIPAVAVQTEHKRERLFLVANANSMRFKGGRRKIRTYKKRLFQNCKTKVKACLRNKNNWCDFFINWDKETTSGYLREDYGLPDRVDRLRSLGNAVVPQIVEVLGYAIVEQDKLF